MHYDNSDTKKMEDITIGLEQLLPTLQALPRAHKLRIVQYLISELAKEEGIYPL